MIPITITHGERGTTLEVEVAVHRAGDDSVTGWRISPAAEALTSLELGDELRIRLHDPAAEIAGEQPDQVEQVEQPEQPDGGQPS